MVIFALQIKATLDNIEMFKPTPTDFRSCHTGSNFRWYFKFSCNNCGEEFKNWNYVSMDVHTTSASNANTVDHFTSKCKFCSRKNSMSIMDYQSDPVIPYTAEDSGKFKTILCFDCRGMTPTDFSPKEGWIAKASDGGKEFEDVDLCEGEWVEYCDRTNKPVGIYDIECNFERI